MTELSAGGRSAEEILAEIDELRADDVAHESGRVFSLVFHAGPEHEAVVAAAHERYLWANALNPAAFGGLQRMQRDVIAITASLLGGDDPAGSADGGLAGFMTSGGTESILCAVEAAKVRWYERRPGADRGRVPNVVLPVTAHAAFDKGCRLFGLEPRRTPVDDRYRADVDAMAARVDDDTALIVASAPQYPQGVIDPVTDVAAIALEHDLHFHVDACMGGYTLPFLAAEGLVDAEWDFRVEGVTTISADLHKYAYVPKGASVIMHRDRESRRRQTFVFDGWLGGLYASPGLLGTRPGGPIAAAWASLQFLGRDGMARMARTSYEARVQLDEGVRAIPGLDVLGRPDATLCAFGAAPGGPDIFAVGDRIAARGWHLDRQGPPDNLHATCTPPQRGAVIDALLADLATAVDELGGARAEDRSATYAGFE
ncbi:MAG: aspartate aminotransferase family protein [Actinomycetota bacterium]|nr:aspartate aminotransferase family protein [Actinomycetota bacterium]